MAGGDWSQQHERGNLFALRLAAWIAVHLGRPVARALLVPITWYFLLFSPDPKRQTRRYLRRALGREPGWGDHYRQVHHFASVVLDRIYLARGARERFDLQVLGGELVHQLLAEGRGAFMLGAHLGSFEVLHAVGKGQQLPVAMVMYPDNARLIQTVLQAVAPDSALEIIAIGRPGSTLAIRDWLDRGGLIGALGDRLPPRHARGGERLPPRPERGTGPLPPPPHGRSGERLLPFLGKPAAFSDGPLRLAQVLRRKVMFMVGLYGGGNRYEVRFELLADFTQVPPDAAGREAQLQAALADYVRRLEALCRASPYNWFNFYDFWHED
ncbi:MAG: acyl-CoA synthetase [Proteobacteria bacterium]|nr:acyl-CoA synthetase [Pseudomonadota bacterium]